MTEINKVPISKVNNTLTRLPIAGEFTKEIEKMNFASQQYASTQETQLGKKINQEQGGVTVLTQSDLYPASVGGSSVPPIVQAGVGMKSDELQNGGKKELQYATEIGKMTHSMVTIIGSVTGNGYIHSKIMLGTPQAIKNSYFQTVGKEPDPSYAPQFAPSSLQGAATTALTSMSSASDYSSQIASVSNNVIEAVTGLSQKVDSLVGNKNLGVTQRAILKTENYLDGFLKNISQGTLTEEETDRATDLIIAGNNSQVIDIVQAAGRRENKDLGDISALENSIMSVNASAASSITNQSSSFNNMGVSSRKTKDLATISNNWNGANTPAEYTFERVHSVEELVAELRSVTRPITETIVHWTANFNDQGHIGAREIHNIGLRRGFAGCSYHYVIKRNGNIERGRPVNIKGAHARAAGHNNNSIGISFVAGYNCPTGTPNPNRYISAESITPAQFAALDSYLKAFFMVYPGGQVFGHQDFDSNKPDPGFDVGTYIKSRFNKVNVSNPNNGPISETQMASILAETTQGETIA